MRASSQVLVKLVLVLSIALHQGAIASQARLQTGAATAATAPAQTNSLSPARPPDIVGFRPGLPLEEADKRLKAYNPKAKLDVGEVSVPELGAKPLPVTLRLELLSSIPRAEIPEIIQLEITLPPEKPVVWGVLRRMFVEPGKEMTRTNLLAELRRQYGPESYGITVPIVNLYWAFDEQGHRVERGTSSVNNCALPGVWDLSLNRSGSGSRSSRFPGKSLLLSAPAATGAPCKPMLYVKALLQPSGKQGLELIESTMVEIVDGALAARAQAATAALRATAAETRKK